MHNTRPWLKFIVNNDENGGGESNKPSAEDLQKSLEGEQPEEEKTPEKEEEPGETNLWAEKFGDLTPDEVQGQIDELKRHSRNWEKRSKDNFAELEKLRKSSPEDNSQVVAELQHDLGFYTDLIGMAVTSENPAGVIQLLDSRAFRLAYDRLDRDADNYADALTELIDARSQSMKTPQQTPQRRHGGGERYDDHAADVGNQLFEQLYGNTN